jgi:chromosome segregation ATPase
MTILALAFCLIAIAVNHNRMKWKTQAQNCQTAISDCETDLQSAMNDFRVLDAESQTRKTTEVALIGDREVLRKQLAISQDTVAMLKTEIDELRVAEQTQAEKHAEFEATRKQATELQVGLRFAKEQRDKSESARISLSEQRDKLRAEVANLKDTNERIVASNGFLVRECEKMDAQLKAIREALVIQPEPAE